MRIVGKKERHLRLNRFYGIMGTSLATAAGAILMLGLPLHSTCTTQRVAQRVTQRIELDPIFLSAQSASRYFHGHGALSAGASSRLLHDYQEPMRSDILDYLFKPNWGASLQILKIEIGGDTQSTDGTEPSHQHFRGENSHCTRGYESWLAVEAKKRNPNISVYGLSWGVPGWIGNGSTSTGAVGTSYCTQDNIDYQTAWVTCMSQTVGVDIEFLGIWNEKSWCSIDYVLRLRKALTDAGHVATTLVLPDGSSHMPDVEGNPFLTQLEASANLREAAPIVGYHYPCGNVQGVPNGTTLWASEDFSQRNLGAQDPAGDGWNSGSYWGRLLNQNFIRMNATTTIAWAMIWSVLPQLTGDGSGLTLANQPWSGYYEADAALWTTAHWTQFIGRGWKLTEIGQGSGFLPKGGSYVTAVGFDDSNKPMDFSIVLESLRGVGRCKPLLNCTSSQFVQFKLAPELLSLVPRTGLAIWTTNSSDRFIQGDHINPIGSIFNVTIPVDTMITISTVRTANKGRASTPIPKKSSFPLPYSEDFEEYDNDTMARYFSDQGGSFAVVREDNEELVSGNKVLRQFVLEQPGANSWGFRPSNPPPVTIIGDMNWHNYEACVDASMQDCNVEDERNVGCYVMICSHVTAFSTWSGWLPTSLCLQLNISGGWSLVSYTNTPRSVTNLYAGNLSSTMVIGPGSPSNRLCLALNGCSSVSASINAKNLLPLHFQIPADVAVPFSGRAALASGWHTSSFDNFTVTPFDSSSSDVFECIRQCNSTQEYIGFVGSSLVFDSDVTVAAVARFCGGPDPPSERETAVLVISEYSNTTTSGKQMYKLLLSTTVTIDPGCSSADSHGFVWVDLPSTLQLHKGEKYLLAFGNQQGWKFYGGAGCDPEVGSTAQVLPIYTSATTASVLDGTAAWTEVNSPGKTYGPLNARLKPTESDQYQWPDWASSRHFSRSTVTN